MTHNPDGDFNYIGQFVDHFSKFHIVFPQRKTAKDIYLRSTCKDVCRLKLASEIHSPLLPTSGHHTAHDSYCRFFKLKHSMWCVVGTNDIVFSIVSKGQ